MDALSDILRVSRLSSGVFLNAEFSAPWCMIGQMSPEHCAPFLGAAAHLIPYHYVVDGELYVAEPKGRRQQVRRGEVVIFPHNDLYLMGSDISLPPVSAASIIVPEGDKMVQTVLHGGGGDRVHMVCGFLGCDSGLANPIVSTLPSAMILKVDDTPAADWIRSTFQYAAYEVASGRTGSTAVLSKLSELLFVEAVRQYVQGIPDGQTGWLAGLRDPAVSRALGLMHANIVHGWSVDELGREVGISRSGLAERFTRVIGMAPMHYLADWRLQVAAQKLRDSGDPLVRIAEQVGYESEAAFSRAFKKKFGAAPATWRRAEQAQHG
ncbi:MAG: AraC family transcriptional regulator [Gemmatimonadota bacterium]|nr:AraC family transcriptional regulator [Reyranella sp.]